MVLDPIELLEQRLNEIEAVDCNDIDFIAHKLKYKATIDFLRLHGFESSKDGRIKVSEFNRRWLRKNYEKGQEEYYTRLFKISKTTLRNILTEEH